MHTRFGRYRLVRHLATGGMGEVYLAEAVGAAGFAKRVVIKTLREDLAADERLVGRFVQEGRLLEALDHPRIAQILDLGVQQNTYFLAMEYVAGFDLRDLRRELPERDGARRLGEVGTLCIVVAVAEALDHAQTRPGPDGRPLRIVHHDVTPSNIMVRPDGHAKLVDFGVAITAMRGRMSERALRGKLPYLSPEQAGLAPVDGRADIFSLGLVAMELLSGERTLDVVDAASLPGAYAAIPGRLQQLRDIGVAEPTVTLIAEMVAIDRAGRPSAAFSAAERARARLLALGESSVERVLGRAFSAAFDTLTRRADGFDATLKGIVGARRTHAPPAPAHRPHNQPPMQGLEAPPPAPAAAADGTVSLPGLQGFAAPTPSDLPELSPPQPVVTADEPAPPGPVAIRLRKRVIFALIVALGLVGGMGWWLGSRGTPAELPVPAVSAAVAPGLPDAALQAADTGAPPSPEPASRPSASPPSAAAPATPTAAPQGPPAPPSAPPPAAADAATVAPETRAAPPSARQAPPRPRARGTATLDFLVLPADAEVRVDGQPITARKTGRYRLRLSAGSHVVHVRDRHSGRSESRTVKLRAGEQRRLRPGFALALP